MSLKGRTREIVMGVSLLALLIYLFGPALSTPDELLSESDRSSPTVSGVNAVLDGPDVDLALLTQQPGDYKGQGRNLFDYGRIAPPLPTQEELEAARLEALRLKRLAEAKRESEDAKRARMRQEALDRQKKLAETRKPISSQPPAPAKPKPPNFPYQFIGVIGPAEAKIAIFVDDKDFLMAQEGETLKEDFRIVKIGYDTLQIGYTDPQFEEESRILQMGKDKK